MKKQQFLSTLMLLACLWVGSGNLYAQTEAQPKWVPLEMANLQLNFTDKWKIEMQEHFGIHATSPDGKVQFFAYVTDDHSIDDAVKSMQKDLDKYMDNVKLSNAEVTFEGNGLKVYSSGGTGDSTTEGGQPSRFIIDFIETHTDEHIIVAFLAIGTDAEIEANATDLYYIFNSVKENH
ncbi:MAG: hypothetical protein IPN94_07035 [Sphingobacteriales bacterium]|nr:hypothetical protein [Sphingobacteriales bacterium]